MERIDKILSNSGFGTRKEVKKLIKYGAVKVGGAVINSPDVKIDTDNDVITVGDKLLNYRKFIYLMLNKPCGYISATEDGAYPAVTELIPEEYAHFGAFPAGRLDVDTEGLLILTNDGVFAHNITSPKKHVQKKYFAVTERPITKQDIKEFESGMNLGDFTAMPSVLEECDGGCIVTIYEGKFHQVKRMFEKTGNKVVFLKRVRIGGLELDKSLDIGEIRELTKGELDSIWI